MAATKPKAALRPRRRRTAEEAKDAILDAAERRLSELGPDGLRLQQIATDVGVSHPAILHHFESRERLLREVVRRAIRRLETDIVSAIGAAEGTEEPPALALIEEAHRVLVDNGHARVLAWLMLSGQDVAAGPGVRTIAEATHARRTQAEPDATFEDTVFRVILAALAMIGEAVAGPSLRGSAGLGDDPDAPLRFRAWLARMLVTEVEKPPAPAEKP